jgi:hypothetical protein
MRPRASAIIACLFLAAAAFAAADPVFTLADPKVFPRASRPGVSFDHGAHQALEGVSCASCHHDFVNLDGGDPSPRCATCHSSPARLQNAFHELCITCHDAEKRRGHVTGPRTCGECHAAR